MSGPPVEGIPTPPPAGPLAGPLVREKITTTVVEREYALPPPPKQQRTMQSFFGGLRAGPSSAGAEAEPVPVLHPFPDDEITHMTETVPTKGGTPYRYIASRVKPDGSLVGQCACYAKHRTLVKNTPQPIRNFTPGDNRQSDHSFRLRCPSEERPPRFVFFLTSERGPSIATGLWRGGWPIYRELARLPHSLRSARCGFIAPIVENLGFFARLSESDSLRSS